jgi:4-amino-4-deoxy-L-arabinose transferase-like glycosyltransferase
MYGIIDPSDGIYAEGSREMLERGQWLTPLFNYKPFYEKPIGIYWSVIAAYKIFGIHEFAARLPSAISAVLCSAFVYKVLGELKLPRVGLLSALVLIGAPLFGIVGHLCLTDMLFTCALSVGVLSLFAYSSGLRRLYLWLGYVALAVAVLVKGPAALVLAALTIGVYLAVRSLGKRDQPWWQVWWRQILYLKPIKGMLIILGINLPWYVFESINSRGAFFQEFFIRQHLRRAAGQINHQAPWYYYLPVLFAGFAPWYLFLTGFVDAKRQILENHTRRADLALLCVCWSALVVGIFSIASAKLATYILPALPPLAILTGIGMDYLIRLQLSKRVRIIGASISFIAVCCLIGISLAESLWDEVTDLVVIILPLFVFAVLSGLVISKERRTARQVYVLAASYALATAVGVPAMLHGYDEVKYRPLKNLAKVAADSGGSLATFMRDSPAVLFYARKPVPLIRTPQEFRTFLTQSPAPHFVITTANAVAKANVESQGMQKVAQQGKWCLYRTN